METVWKVPQFPVFGTFIVPSVVLPNLITSVLPVREQKIRVSWAVDYYNKADKKELLLKKIRRVIGTVEKK